jgi:hypothetical protein
MAWFKCVSVEEKSSSPQFAGGTRGGFLFGKVVLSSRLA